MGPRTCIPKTNKGKPIFFFCSAGLVFPGFKMLPPFSITVVFVSPLLAYREKKNERNLIQV